MQHNIYQISNHMMAFHLQWQPCNMQRHDTLAYIENTITGNLDKQQQSMATNQTPIIWRKDDKQSSSTVDIDKPTPVVGLMSVNKVS